jgi:hypothetical protein
VVTRNHRDFSAIHSDWTAHGRAHSGVVFAHSRTLHPGKDDRAFVRALARLLGARRGEHEDSSGWWLRRSR